MSFEPIAIGLLRGVAMLEMLSVIIPRKPVKAESEWRGARHDTLTSERDSSM